MAAYMQMIMEQNGSIYAMIMGHHCPCKQIKGLKQRTEVSNIKRRTGDDKALLPRIQLHIHMLSLKYASSPSQETHQEHLNK